MKKTSLIIVAIVFTVFFTVSPLLAGSKNVTFYANNHDWGDTITSWTDTKYHIVILPEERRRYAGFVRKTKVNGVETLHIHLPGDSTMVEYKEGKTATISSCGLTVRFSDMVVTVNYKLQ